MSGRWIRGLVFSVAALIGVYHGQGGATTDQGGERYRSGEGEIEFPESSPGECRGTTKASGATGFPTVTESFFANRLEEAFATKAGGAGGNPTVEAS